VKPLRKGPGGPGSESERFDPPLSSIRRPRGTERPPQSLYGHPDFLDQGPVLSAKLLPANLLFESSLSNPEGYFGGNQLPDGSMGLSPLYPGLTNDLHVSTAANLHQGFPWLHPTQA